MDSDYRKSLISNILSLSRQIKFWNWLVGFKVSKILKILIFIITYTLKVIWIWIIQIMLFSNHRCRRPLSLFLRLNFLFLRSLSTHPWLFGTTLFIRHWLELRTYDANLRRLGTFLNCGIRLNIIFNFILIWLFTIIIFHHSMNSRKWILN